jgi:hypothetical protein
MVAFWRPGGWDGQSTVHSAGTPDRSAVRAYRIADNQLALDIEWDMDLLRLELTDLDLDIALTGSERDELDEILGLNTPEKGGPDRELSDSERDAMDQACTAS